MIGGMRKFARSKWALGLFALLIISFGIFGLQDNFGGVSAGGLAQIGKYEIHARDVNAAVSREIDRLRVSENKIVSQADAVREGITQQQLLQLEYRNTLLAYADKIGVRASPEAVNNLVLREADAFKDALGRVSVDQIRAAAQQRGETVKQFEEGIRDDLTAQYLEAAAYNALRTPDILTAPVIKYLGESRVVTVARLSESAIAPPKEPTADEMKAWYESHKDMFNQPERRRISVLSYSPEDLLDKVTITDDQVKAEYEKRIRDFSTPETREMVEFTGDRNAIQQLVDLSKQGKSLEDAQKGATGALRADRKVKPEEISDERLRELIFGLPVNELRGPFQLGEGAPFMAVVVKSITPGVPKPFAEVEADVRRELTLPGAEAQFEESSESFRDAAGGQALEEIGKQFGVPVIQLAAVNNNAQTEKGDQSKLLAANPDAVRELFTLQAGQLTNVFEGDNVLAMYRLDEIVAPHTLAFEQVRDRVRLEHMREQIENAADKAANDMVAAVKAGKTFEQSAAASKFTVLPGITLSRAANPPIDPQVAQAAFNLKAGETATARDRNRAPWVVRVDKIDAVTPEMAASLKQNIGAQVSELLARDFAEVFQRGIQKEVPYKRDEVAVQQYLESFVKDEAQ